MLFSYLSEKKYPIAWTFHDCWNFTGICFHYTSINCYKWKTECNSVCPQHQPWLTNIGADRVRKMFQLKKKHFSSIEKMEIIPVSHWLENEVKQSFLSKYPVHHIYNWIDLNKFRPVYDDIRTKYNIPNSKNIVLSVGAKWDKNSTKYLDAIKLSQNLPKDMCLVMVGSLARGTSFPPNIIHIPYINGTDELAKVYSSAMVYVHLSVEDTFGKVIAEAMACGTPAIVFNSTAIPELVGKGCGYIAQPHKISEMMDYIKKVKLHGRSHYSENCIKRVKVNFDSETNMNKYLQVYKRLLN